MLPEYMLNYYKLKQNKGYRFYLKFSKTYVFYRF